MHRLLVLLLGAFLALGLSLSAVQAGEMAVKMTLGSDMGTSGDGDCRGCGGDDGAAKTGACHPACTIAGAAVLPAAAVVVMAAPDLPARPAGPVSSGRVFSPDPSPPKAGVHG